MTKINFRVDSSENFKSANTELSKGEPTLSSSFPYELKVSSSDDLTWDQAITINPVTEYTPTNINEVFSAGLITFDNNFLYIKTSDGWKQIALVDLGSVVNPPQPPTGPTTTTTTTTADPSATTTTTTADPSATTTTTTADPSATTTTTTADPSSTTTTTTTTSTTTSTTTTTTLPPASFSTSILTFGLDEDNIKDDTTSYDKKSSEDFRNYGFYEGAFITESGDAEEIEVDGVSKLEWTFPGYIHFFLMNLSSTNDPMNVSVSLKQGNTLISTETSTITGVNDSKMFSVKMPLYLRPDFDSSYYLDVHYWASIGSDRAEWQIVNGKLHTPLDASVLTVRTLMQNIMEDPFTEVSAIVEDRTDQEGVFLFADNPDVTLEITTNQYCRIFFNDYEYENGPNILGTTLFSKTISDYGNLESFPQYIMRPNEIYPVFIMGSFDQRNRQFGSMKTRLKSLPSSIPSRFHSLKGCFSGTSSRLTSSVTSWDTTNINDMEQLCYDSEFNQDISSWNTANVQTFERAFSAPYADSSTVANTRFFYETVFNRPIGAWNTSSAEIMAYMFQNNTSFNQIISNWDTSKVSSLSLMFANAVFNQDISSWDTSAVTHMYGMFLDNSVFNQPIGIWDTSSLTTVAFMFNNASAFDQVLSNWTFNNLVSTLHFALDSGFTQTNFRDTVIAFDNNTSQTANFARNLNFSPVLGPSTDIAYLTAFFSLESKNLFIKDGDNQ